MCMPTTETVKPCLPTRPLPPVPRLTYTRIRHPMVQSIVDSKEADNVVSGKPAVMVKFSATWCGPCKAVAPIIDRLEPNYPHVFMCDVDTDTCTEFAAAHGVTAMPTFVFFNKGHEMGRVVGGDVSEVVNKLRELSALQTESFGKGQRIGSKASTNSSKALSADEIREARARALEARMRSNDSSSSTKMTNAGQAASTSPSKDAKSSPHNSGPATREPERRRRRAPVEDEESGFPDLFNIFSGIFKPLLELVFTIPDFVMNYAWLYLATLFSLDSRSTALKMSKRSK